MKPKVVEVDTQSSEQHRSVGDAPDLGDVPKAGRDQVTSGVSVETPASSEQEESSSPAWPLRLAVMVLIIGVFVAGAGVILRTAKIRLNPGPMASANETGEQSESMPAEVAEEPKIDEKEVLDMVRRGLAVRNASRVTDYFLYAEPLDPVAVVRFLKSLSEEDGLIVGMECLEPVEREGVVMARVRVHSSASGVRQSRDAYLLKDEQGEWKIDYASFADRSEPDLTQLLEKPAEDAP